MFYLIVIVVALFSYDLIQASDRFIMKEKLIYHGRPSFVTYNPAKNLYYGIREVGNKNYIFISYDDGKNWQARNEFPFKYIEHFNIDNAGNIYFVQKFYGNSTKLIIRSMDDMDNFDTVRTFDYDEYLADIKISSKNEIFIFCYGQEHHKILWSKDLGNNWDSKILDFKINQMCVTKDNNIFLISETSDIFNPDSYSDKKLVKSVNYIYQLDINTKTTKLIMSSISEDSPKRIFNEIIEHNGSFFLVSVIHDCYVSYGEYYSRSYSNPILLELNPKNLDKIRTIDLHLNTSVDRIRMNFNNHNQLVLFSSYYNRWMIFLFSDDYATYKIQYIDKWDLPPGLEFKGYKGNEIIVLSNYEGYSYLSNDGGNSWEIYYPFVTDNLYLSKSSKYFYTDMDGRIFSSDSLGFNGDYISNNIDTSIKTTCIFESPNGNIILGTEKSGILYRNESGTWEERNKGLKNLTVNQISENTKGELVICTDGGLYLCKDECLNYEMIYDKPAKEVVEIPTGYLLVTTNGELYLLEYDNGFLKNEIKCLPQYFITSVAVNSRGVAIAATSNNGVFKSTNFGKSWKPANNEFYSPIVYQVISTQKGEFIALAQTGIFFSNNDGEMWEKNNYEGLWTLSDGRYKMKLLRDNTIFYNIDYGETIIDSISSEPIKEASGWIESGNYSYNKFSVRLRNLIFSKDSKIFIGLEEGVYQYVPYLWEYNYNHVPRFTNNFYIFEYSTGKLIEERIIPFHYTEYKILTFDESGNVLLFFNDAEQNRFVIFNLFFYKEITDFQISKNPDFLCTDISGSLNSDSQEIILKMSFDDPYKVKYENAGFTEVQKRDFNGNLIDMQEYDFYLKDAVFSSENRLIAGKMFMPYIDSTNTYNKKTEYLANSLNLIDYKNGNSYTLDTANVNVQYSQLNFSENDRYLIDYIPYFANNDTSKAIIFALDSVIQSESIIYKYTYSNGKSTANFSFSMLSDTEMIIYSYDSKISNLRRFFTYNLINNTITRKSDLYGFNFNDKTIFLTPNQKNFIINSNPLYTFSIDRTLSEYAMDFYADKQVSKANESISFFANDHPYAANFVWDFGDGSLGFGKSPQHVYTQQGKFTIRLYFTDDMLKDSVVKSEYITIDGISEVEQVKQNEQLISICPNPVSDILNISFNQTVNGSMSISIIDRLGMEYPLIRNELTGFHFAREFDLSHLNLPQGLYFVKLKLENLIFTRKFIKIQ